jgi:hypothetical protein
LGQKADISRCDSDVGFAPESDANSKNWLPQIYAGGAAETGTIIGQPFIS